MIKDKILRLKKWILGFVIPTVSAATLYGAIPPEDTTYKIEYKRAFSSQELLDKTLKEHPEMFPNVTEIGSSGNGLGYPEVSYYVEFDALTTAEAVEKTKDFRPKPERISAKLMAKDFFGFYHDKTEQGEIDKAEPSTIISYLVQTALAVYPTDNFESYSTGDINGGAGGSNWSENWGATTACNAAYDVTANGTLEGAQELNALNTSGVCRRNFASETTDDNAVQWITRIASYSANNWLYQIWRTGSATADNGAVLICYESGNFVTYNNTTLTDIVTCSTNTNYTVKLTVKPSTEQHRYTINGTNYPGDATYYNLHSYTTIDYTGGLDNFYMEGAGTSHSAFIDDIKNVPPAVATVKQESPKKFIPSNL